MLIRPADQAIGEDEWRSFVASQRFGHFVVAGRESEFPSVVPTQFALDGWRLLCHFAVGNPVLDALEAQAKAVMSVAGDWAFIPSSWNAVGDEDPLLGIPTTYYAAVQLRGKARVMGSPREIAEVLRAQLHDLQPSVPVADPFQAHPGRLKAVRAVVLTVEEVLAKFKYGGNVDAEHQLAVIEHLTKRGSPGDLAAASHAERRLRRAEENP